MKSDRLSFLRNLVLTATLISTILYSASYPYIYAEMMSIVPKFYVSIENIIGCVGTIVFCWIWNKYSDRLFRYYLHITILEILADAFLFIDVLVRQDYKFYFLLNVIIYAIITRNMCCGGTKIRAKINPTESLRERFDNTTNILDSIGTILGAALFMILNFSIKTLFILAFLGNIMDNIFYIYVFFGIKNLNSSVELAQQEVHE